MNKIKRHPNSRGKLTVAQVKALRKKAFKCETIKDWDELGKEFGLVGATARKVANRQTYKWVV